MDGVKVLPPGLPSASSPKWHNRRMWDSLGYLRVRSLANPHWKRDLPWLTAWLRRESSEAGEALHPLYEAAVQAAARYPRTSAGERDSETSWDELLTCIDQILIRHQQAHLDQVRAAGASGKDVPPADPYP
jgi:hypothetical protein